MHRPNAVEVDLGAIRSNARIVRKMAGPDTMLFGAVKCNGYGLGLPAVARAILSGGGDGFTLTDPVDAARIRDGGITAPILLYGGVLPSRRMVDWMHELDLMCTVTDASVARAFSEVCSPSRPLRVFAKIDVGFERLGTYPEDAESFFQLVRTLPGLTVVGMYTHVHGSEHTAYVDWQLDRFDRLLDKLDSNGIRVPIRMGESSATLGLQDRPRVNAVDPGHLLYGILPAGRTVSPANLRPALRSLKSRIIQIKEVSRRNFEELAPYPVRDGMRIGVIPIGRGDGLRGLNAGYVRVRERLVPIVGRLSLEHTRIDVTGLPDCGVGDEVEIVGGAPGAGLSASEVAAANQLDAVGLLMEIRSSIPRVYVDS